MNERLGKIAVRFAFAYVRRRYRREIRLGVAATLLGVAVAVFLASRNVREG